METYHKFLGARITRITRRAYYTFDNAGSEVAALIRDKFRVGLENIEKLLVRNELKVRVYVEYFLSSNRFILSVHDLTTTQLKEIDAMTHRYLKKWLGIPRCGSWNLVHDRHGLNIKSISHLYKESRALSLSDARIFSDDRVKHALDSKEARESNWSRKFSSAVYTRDLISGLIPPPTSPTLPPDAPLIPPSSFPSPSSFPCPSSSHLLTTSHPAPTFATLSSTT